MAKKAKKEAQTTPAQAPAQKLTAEQEINALRAAHTFFSNFDRVPGSYANQWSQALDAIAVVANSLIGKGGVAEPASPAGKVEQTPPPAAPVN